MLLAKGSRKAKDDDVGGPRNYRQYLHLNGRNGKPDISSITLEIDVDDVCFTQLTCGGKFKDGRPLKATIKAMQASDAYGSEPWAKSSH